MDNIDASGSSASNWPSRPLPGPLQGGKASAFSLSLKSLTLQDQVLAPVSAGVTCIVGGNNSGKSTVLTQVLARVTDSRKEFSPNLVTGVEVSRGGSAQDVAAWLQEHNGWGPQTVGPNDQDVFKRPGTGSAHWSVLEQTWKNKPDLGHFASMFIYFAKATERHLWTHPAERRGSIEMQASGPMQVIEDSLSLQQKLSDIALEAFGEPLTLDFLSSSVGFRVGEPGAPPPPVNQITSDYRRAMMSLPHLMTQGDGMVSMMGALIPIVGTAYPVTLLDEPEAFLHPPQAFIMGKTLAKLAQESGTQVIVATHDRNIIRGLTHDSAADVSILRLNRSQDKTTVRSVPVKTVRVIAKSPLLRHSNIMEGLFHGLVILAENARDCTFYAAALDFLQQSVGDSVLEPAARDALFVPTNGKGNMASYANILRGTGVRVVASVDLDLLNLTPNVKSLVEALGGTWDAEIQGLLKRATSDFRERKPGRLNKDVLAGVKNVLEEDPEGTFTSEVRKRITQEIKVTNPWDALKKVGKDAMTSDRAARDGLFDALDRIGIVLVKVGELEGFDRDVPGAHTDAWLNTALERESYKRPEVQAHIRRLLDMSTLN